MAAVDRVDVFFVDVGQGDCTLIVLPGVVGQRIQILIDCGSLAGGGQAPLNFLDCHDNPYIDHLIITHPDGDHYNKIRHLNVFGFTCIRTHCGGDAAGYPGGSYSGIFFDNGVNINFSNGQTATDLYNQFAAANNLIQLGPYVRAGIPIPAVPTVNQGVAGNIVRLPGGTLEVEFSILYSAPFARNVNDQSLVTALRVKATSNGALHQFLFTGDLQDEAALINSGVDVSATTILKLGHHGSNTSSSPAFIDLMPNLLFATVSHEETTRYRHPHLDVRAILIDHWQKNNHLVLNGGRVSGAFLCGAWYRHEGQLPLAWQVSRYMPVMGSACGTARFRVVSAPGGLFVSGEQHYVWNRYNLHHYCEIDVFGRVRIW